MAITINQGTNTPVASDAVGTVHYQIIKLDVGAAGASSAFTGTLGAVTNLAGGTVTALTKGTISTGTFSMTTGTISVGTLDVVSQFPPNPWQTTISSGTNTLGTIKAAVAGSSIFITDLIISVGTPSNVTIGMGGTSTPLMGTFFFGINGGMVVNFRVPGSVTAGSALVYQQSSNGALTIYAAGFVR